MQSPFNPYMGYSSTSPFYDLLSMPLMGGGANNSGLGPNSGQQNDSMVGGLTDQNVTGMFGTDLFNDQGFKDAFNNNKPAAPTDKMNQAYNNAPPAQPTASVVPGLPSAPTATGGMSQADVEAANNAPAGVPGSQHSSPNAVGGMMGGAEAAAAAAAAESAAPAGVPGSEQNSPNAVGGMAANGMATGVTSGEHGLGGGGSGGGSGGGGEGGVGQGAGSGPSGTDPGGQAGGVGGVGQGGMGMGGGQGEGGNGGWAKGGRITHQSPFLVDPNPFNADDMPIEAQKDEHVVTVKASKGLGRKFLDAANKEFDKKGADRKAILKKLAPMLGKD